MRSMQYVKFHYTNPFAGCDADEYIAFNNPMTESELNDWAEEGAQLNGENYEYLANGWDADPTNEDYESNLEFYWEDVSGYFEIITKEEWEENNGTIED